MLAQLIEGFAIKAIGLGLAIYVASHAGIAVLDLFGRINSAFMGVN